MISVSRGRRGTSSGLPSTLPARAEALGRAPPPLHPLTPPTLALSSQDPAGGGPRLVAFRAGLPWARQVHAGAGAAAGWLRQSLRSAVAASEPRTGLAKARQQRHRCAFSLSTDGHVGNEPQVSKTPRRHRDGGSEARVPLLPACRPGSSPSPCGLRPLRSGLRASASSRGPSGQPVPEPPRRSCPPARGSTLASVPALSLRDRQPQACVDHSLGKLWPSGRVLPSGPGLPPRRPWPSGTRPQLPGPHSPLSSSPRRSSSSESIVTHGRRPLALCQLQPSVTPAAAGVAVRRGPRGLLLPARRPPPHAASAALHSQRHIRHIRGDAPRPPTSARPLP